MPLPTIDLTQATDTELVQLASKISTEQQRRTALSAARAQYLTALRMVLDAGGDPETLIQEVSTTSVADAPATDSTDTADPADSTDTTTQDSEQPTA